ncbi:transposase [Ferruginibacter paludis]|uniref:transposase n=1 Tax=Ferruginibacter paludis TaxID=1310417 RepID=UPI0025B563A4|nr:transposase [Ferruginibacter paludis]MDN3655290.1 transposase [Ferruginibacter paludis]
MDYYQPLVPDCFYHILSRANGNERLFIEQENYRFFLSRFDKYISLVADTFAYNLLPNHFHFFIKIKPVEILLQQFLSLHPKQKEYDGWQPEFVMQQCSNLLNSYAKSFNKRYNRKGALFTDYLRRVPIESQQQFTDTIFYIHKNAVHHGLCKTIGEWPWSSYKTILSTAATKIKREEVLQWFGNEAAFVQFHGQDITPRHAVVVE